MSSWFSMEIAFFKDALAVTNQISFCQSCLTSTAGFQNCISIWLQRLFSPILQNIRDYNMIEEKKVSFSEEI